MSVTPADLLRLARELAARADEASLRAAAGRAYYTAYHVCLALADSRGFQEWRRQQAPSTGSHEALIRFLENFGSDPASRTVVRSLGQRPRRARDIRTRADYHINADFGAQFARQAIAGADRIAESVQKM